jgi:hypothetical protein
MNYFFLVLSMLVSIASHCAHIDNNIPTSYIFFNFLLKYSKAPEVIEKIKSHTSCIMSAGWDNRSVLLSGDQKVVNAAVAFIAHYLDIEKETVPKPSIPGKENAMYASHCVAPQQLLPYAQFNDPISSDIIMDEEKSLQSPETKIARLNQSAHCDSQTARYNVNNSYFYKSGLENSFTN